MKIKNLLQFVFILMAGQLLFSCNSAKYYEFSAGKQAPYKVAQEKKAPEAAPAETPSVSEIALEAAAEDAEVKAVAPVLEASTITATPAKAPVAVKENTVAAKSTITEAEALSIAKEHLKSMTKAEKKELKKEVKEAMRQDGSRVSIVEIILAIFLPPLAVFLHDGLGSTFWISLLLTLLFFIPGVIYALLVVTDTI